jgi:hypothetical protein
MVNFNKNWISVIIHFENIYFTKLYKFMQNKKLKRKR